MKKGDIVRFKNVVDPGDEKVKMRLLENPDGVCRILKWREGIRTVPITI